MRLKYYLKGLGIGLIMASLLMGLATKKPVTMTDEEIKIRAKELGMVEQKTLADKRQEYVSQITERPEATMPPVTTAAPPEESKTIETVEPVQQEPMVTEEANVGAEEQDETVPDVSENPEELASTDKTMIEQENIIFEIQKGESSDSVCNRLEAQGLVEDAVSYNNYLCNNGYDRKLNIGTYELSIGMTEEEIAKIITRTR